MDPNALGKCLKLLQKRWGALFEYQVTNIVAYGSAVMPQTADHKLRSNNTLDLLVEVKNPQIFHAELMKRNSNEYAGLAWALGPSWLSFTTKSIFPMHSNHILLEGQPIKYSVIGQSYFREDLRTWKYLSFAGRLQKAVIPLQPYQEHFEEDVYYNRQAALAVALLLKRKASNAPFQQIIENICQISYAGDIRFSAGAENPRKIQNIVTHSYDQLHSIYYPILEKFSKNIKDIKVEGQDRLSFQLTPPFLAGVIPLLPFALREELIKLYGGPNLVEKILIGGASELGRELTAIIVKKNRWSSLRMATENMLTASPLNNIHYLLAKLKKKKL